jgi:ribosomal-protein-alanine N-acetyltransferase
MVAWPRPSSWADHDPAGRVPVRLVPLRRRHLRQVLRIEAQVYPRPWSLGLFLSELALRATRRYWAAWVDDQIVGYCGLMIGAGEGHVTTIAVAPEWQRHKIGTRLMLEMFDEALRQGISDVTLEVRVGNLGAQALYRAFGFEPAGVRPNYYAEIGEDALVMWARGIDSEASRQRIEAIRASLVAAGGRGEEER